MGTRVVLPRDNINEFGFDSSGLSVIGHFEIKEDDRVGKAVVCFGKGLFSVRYRWSFLVLFIYVSGLLFFFYRPIGLDPFCVRVDIDLCSFGACFRHRRRLFQIPMSPR